MTTTDQLAAALTELLGLEADGMHASENSIEVWERARLALAAYNSAQKAEVVDGSVREQFEAWERKMNSPVFLDRSVEEPDAYGNWIVQEQWAAWANAYELGRQQGMEQAKCDAHCEELLDGPPPDHPVWEDNQPAASSAQEPLNSDTLWQLAKDECRANECGHQRVGHGMHFPDRAALLRFAVLVIDRTDAERAASPARLAGATRGEADCWACNGAGVVPERCKDEGTWFDAPCQACADSTPQAPAATQPERQHGGSVGLGHCIRCDTPGACRDTDYRHCCMAAPAPATQPKPVAVAAEDAAKIVEAWGQTHEPWVTVNAQNMASKLARAIRAATPHPAPAVANCEHCGGTGELFMHAEDCNDELCALNGDVHSCVGRVEPCACQPAPAVAEPTAPCDWVTEFCAKYSGEDVVKAGDVLDFLMRLPMTCFLPAPAGAVDYAKAVSELAERQGMTDEQVLRAAIRLYQAECNGSVEVIHKRDSMLAAPAVAAEAGQGETLFLVCAGGDGYQSEIVPASRLDDAYLLTQWGSLDDIDDEQRAMALENFHDPDEWLHIDPLRGGKDRTPVEFSLSLEDGWIRVVRLPEGAATQPAQPLSEDDLDRGVSKWLMQGGSDHPFTDGVRWAEMMHGIQPAGNGKAGEMNTKPATPAEAEEHAKKAVADYLNACGMTDAGQIGNYLMKLASVAGVLMANAEGSVAAFDRLLGTAQFVLKTMPKKPAAVVKVQ